MAKVKLHGMFVGVSGRLDDFVLKKRNGKQYICRRPDFSKRKLSPAQKKSIARFRDAVAHAKRTLKDEEAAGVYAGLAKKSGKSVYNFIIAEYLRNHER